jgi:myotubularin-related protein 3/4
MAYCIGNCLPKEGIAQENLSDPKKNSAIVHIFDARSKIAAIGNKLAGSGYENTADYPFAYIAFGAIDNIHAVRESYIKVNQVANDPKYVTSTRWYSEIDKTNLFHNIASTLRLANSTVESIRVCLLLC